MTHDKVRARLAMIALVTAVLAPPASAQTGTLVGTVTDAESLAPLAGADLVVEGTSVFGLSRDDGRFVLTPVPVGEHTLRVQRIGYRTQRATVRVVAGGTAQIDVALTPEPLALERLVVTGAAGTTRLREVGNRVERLEIDDLTERPATLSDFLQGAAVGVEVTGSSGEAGQGKQIRLRGNGSMVLSNQPLVYIDGVRMMEGAFPSEVFEQPGALRPEGANVTTSPLDLVSVGDIDRIEVAKGPAATTLFGTGASNGVIQIFTKRGVSGPPRWTADLSQGTGWVQPFGANGIDYLHVEHFLRDPWWGGGYEGGPGSRDCVTDDPRWKGVNATSEGACSWPGAQWYQRYGLSVGGGGGAFDYYASAEAQNDAYALPLDELERYAFRSNLGMTLTPRVQARFSGSYTRFWTSNTASGRNAEGILLSTMRQWRNYLSSADPRDIADLLANRNDQWIDRSTLGLTTTFAQSPRTSHRLTLGYDDSRQDLLSVQIPEGIFAVEAAATRRDWDRRFLTADYLGSHQFAPSEGLLSTVSFGAQLVVDDLAWNVHYGTGFPNDIPTTPDQADSLSITETASGTTTAGLVAQNVLALGDRYFLTTGLRVDRHETMAASFLRVDPRIGLAWVVSDEGFWPEALGALRLRSAFGRSSTAPSPFLQAVRFVGPDPPADTVDVPALEPETRSEWEVGLDATWLDGRLSFEATAYRQTTTHALVPITVEDGVTRRQELHNVGKVRNEGIEMQIDATLVDREAWGLDAGIGVGTNDSRVLDLGGMDTFSEQLYRFSIGQPVPASYGRRVADPDAVNGPWSADRYLTDADGNTSLPVGAQLPTRFLTPSLSARLPGGLAVSARGEYRGGNVRSVNPVPVSRSVVSPLCLPYYVGPVDSTDPVASVALRDDTPDLWRERCTPSAAADYWFDADYFKLRSVAVTVPFGFAFPDRVQQALLTVTLANAFTWYRDVPWWDVEIPGDEGANGDGVGTSDRVPAPATLTFSLRVRF